MLFNSFEFIFVFLPVMFFVYFFLNKQRWTTAGKVWLALGSLVFYCWWNLVYLPLILFSLLFNYGTGILLGKEKWNVNRKWVLTAGIAVDVGLLGFYKYYDFFITNTNTLFSTDFSLLHLALPLGISFITFQKIAFLVDSYRKETKDYNFLNYCLFVLFFPQLIAGPIVHHQEVMPQFDRMRNKTLNYKNIAAGIFIFSIGLFKKVAIADTLAVLATEGFDGASALTFVEGWAVSLSYTLQLYFDFSGYTDMAIGAALVFNIHLPANFNSPYKALNIQDFWRRWHMTLSRFLTQYIYIPLGGSRHGTLRTYLNVMAVFLISGLWHGAGWNFIFWGFLHGAATVVNRMWKNLHFKMNKYLAWFITFQFVNAAWIFFRAETWEDALKVLKAMSGLSGLTLSGTVLPSSVIEKLGFLSGVGVGFVSQYGIGLGKVTILYILFAAIIVLLVKNTVDWKRDFRLSGFTVLSAIALLSFSLLSLTKISEFLYFNF